MSDRVRLDLPVVECLAGQNFTAEAKFEDRASGVPSAPSTVDFRVDDVTDPSSPIQVADWVSITAGESVSFAIPSNYTGIVSAAHDIERRQITVTGDRGLTFECSDRKIFIVRNRNLGS